MSTENKYGKLAFQIFTLVCATAIGICLICDFAINKRITWSGYPVAAIPFAWVVASPSLLAKRNKILLSVAALTVAIMPFLYLLERLTPVKGWFSGLGVPIAATSIIAAWLMFFLVRVIKNKWYLSAAAVFLFGVVVATAANYFVSRYTGASFIRLDNAINFLSSAAITVLLIIIGNFKRQHDKHGEESEELQ